jgi:hypothetical protein
MLVARIHGPDLLPSGVNMITSPKALSACDAIEKLSEPRRRRRGRQGHAAAKTETASVSRAPSPVRRRRSADPKPPSLLTAAAQM